MRTFTLVIAITLSVSLAAEADEKLKGIACRSVHSPFCRFAQ